MTYVTIVVAMIFGCYAGIYCTTTLISTSPHRNLSYAASNLSMLKTSSGLLALLLGAALLFLMRLLP